MDSENSQVALKIKYILFRAFHVKSGSMEIVIYIVNIMKIIRI